MRKVHWGTPTRSAHYLFPRRTGPLVLAGVAVGAAALVLLGLFDVVGFSTPVSPGHVSSKHMLFDARCQECHVAFAGASDIRCQRCHDPASAGRLTNSAHVFFGSLDPAKAAAAPRVACARCHVEHRGTRALLTAVEEAYCTDCHADSSQLEQPFASFSAHPEFDVLAQSSKQRPGVLFSHLTHVTGKGDRLGYLLKDRQLASAALTCGECHRLAAGSAEFEPISFDRHCTSCHGTDLRMDPVPARDVDSFGDLELALDEAVLNEWGLRAADFEDLGAELLKVRMRHADPWIQHNRRKLWRALEPAAFAAERARLQGRFGQLERRLALANPTAREEPAQLTARIATLEAELAYLDERLAAQASARPVSAGADRLAQVLAAARAAGAQQEAAGALVQSGAVLGSQGVPEAPLGNEQFAERRAELLSVLDAIEKAKPERAAQVAELRQRLELLLPGETTAALLARARQQRVETLQRVRDELALRRSGTRPPSETLMAGERQAIAGALALAARRVADFDRIDDPGSLAPATLARKQQTLQALTKGCAKCHEISALGAQPPVAAAQPVLWRATFTHRDHLTQGETCASCHSGGSGEASWSIETSDSSAELSFRGVASCRECHTPGRVADDCQKCHNYHPAPRQ